MQIKLPELSLIVLIGASGSGKSTFARKYFKSTEILSSDYCRGLVSDDETDQNATKDAFEILHFIAAKRLAAGKLTVIDATNVQAESRQPLLALAREYHVLPIALVFDLPEHLCQQRNQARPDRQFGPHVVRNHTRNLKQSLRKLEKEGFRQIHIFHSVEEMESFEIILTPLWNNRKEEHGPFDIIGDVHGCCDELEHLLAQLGYECTEGSYRHPQGRKAFFVGDLVDRGPRNLDTLRLVKAMVEAGHALCVPGNHDAKLMRKLKGKQVKVGHGLELTLAEIEALPEDIRASFCRDIADFIDSLVSHLVLDDGKLVVAHAGMKETMQGRASRAVREFALYGETTGEIDEFGLPVRLNWASEYRGKALVVYGHTPVPEAEWLNNTINLDTGCVFGGKLTALRYPERELVSIPAQYVYYAPIKPLVTEEKPVLNLRQAQDDLLDLKDVLGKRLVDTRLLPNIMIREENALAALEVMSRFAANPKWLIYLPPTMSPTETSQEPGLLEHPAQAFAYYRSQGVPTVICEEKHMGSRAIIILGKNEQAIQQRFGIIGEGIGICYTRTGRRFFEDSCLEQALLEIIRETLTHNHFWQELDTDWVCLDCELMPWSAKAQELLRQQYSAVGIAATEGLNASVQALEKALDYASLSALEIQTLLNRYQLRAQAAAQFVTSYRRYCWPVESITDLKIAPFHLLATEGKVHTQQTHLWHLEEIKRFTAGHALFQSTRYHQVDVTNPDSEHDGTTWWEQMTTQGGEGMVVKPLDYWVRGKRSLVQPAVKCRGQEYLRIIYGPEYTLPHNLERLRSRGLGAKRSLAVREFALGIEALERFVRREPLHRVHECVFGLLALESEPVDPRL